MYELKFSNCCPDIIFAGFFKTKQVLRQLIEFTFFDFHSQIHIPFLFRYRIYC